MLRYDPNTTHEDMFEDVNIANFVCKDDLNVTDVDPRLDSCKEKIKELERELAIEEKMKLQSVVNSSENMPNFNKLAQTNKTNVLPKLLQQAYTFYVGLYGDPDTEDIQPSDTVPRYVCHLRPCCDPSHCFASISGFLTFLLSK